MWEGGGDTIFAAVDDLCDHPPLQSHSHFELCSSSVLHTKGSISLSPTHSLLRPSKLQPNLAIFRRGTGTVVAGHTPPPSLASLALNKHCGGWLPTPPSVAVMFAGPEWCMASMAGRRKKQGWSGSGLFIGRSGFLTTGAVVPSFFGRHPRPPHPEAEEAARSGTSSGPSRSATWSSSLQGSR